MDVFVEALTQTALGYLTDDLSAILLKKAIGLGNPGFRLLGQI